MARDALIVNADTNVFHVVVIYYHFYARESKISILANFFHLVMTEQMNIDRSNW